MRNQVITSIFVLLVVCAEGKAAPKFEATHQIPPRAAVGWPMSAMNFAPELSAQFKPQGTDGNVWRIAQAQPAASRPPKTFSEGIIAGEAMAEKIGVRWHLFGGFVGGTLSGPGNLLLVLLFVKPADMKDHPEAQSMMSGSGQSFDYQKGFAIGWDKRTKARKLNAALLGTAVGTAAFLYYFFIEKEGHSPVQ